MRKDYSMKKISMNKWFILLLASLCLFLLVCFHAEPDYFWHIKAGEYMLKHGVLTKDVFSWFVSGKYWMSHEWLFEVLLAGLKTLFGKYHVFIYCFLGFILLYSLLYFPNKKGFSKNISYSFIMISFLGILSIFFIQARPHILSFSFFAFTIWVLYDLYQNKDSKKIYFLPLVSILWANFHGGSSNLSYLLCFLFFVVGHFRFQFKKIEANPISKIQKKKYFLVMILCMIGVCINIHGFKMFLYPYQNMMNTTMIENILEWQPTTLGVWYHYIYFAFLITMLFTFLFSEKKISFIDLVLFGFVAYLGIKSIRFWLYGPIAMLYIVFDYVRTRKIDKGTVFFTILISIFFIVGFSLNINPPKESYALSDKMISTIKSENPKRLYNMYDYGGELIYHDIKVFIDGRADLYSSYNYEDYLSISKFEHNTLKLIEKYDFDYFLVELNYPITTYLKSSDEYQLIYQEKNTFFYKKNS